MGRDRLDLLYLSQFPPSPPTFGAQRRMQGLMAALAARHDITAVALLPPELDAGAAERAMREYCREVVLVPARPWHGTYKRLLQLRSLFSTQSYERRFFDVPGLRRMLDSLLSRRAFDIVNVEQPFLAHERLARAPPGRPLPRLVLDEHNIEFHLTQQQAQNESGMARRIHNSRNWPKVRREELGLWRRFDGVTFCSDADEARARALVPSVRSAVIPNSVDVEYFKRRPHHPPSDGSTVLFFGAINYYPNVDGLLYLLREVWPLIAKSHPRARLKIVGQHPTPEILAFRGERIEVSGQVEDVRPHLSSAAVSVAPLRIGGGSRFKILEAMAMARPVVSTSLGAEGIEFEPGRHLLLADDAPAFAGAVGRVLDDAQLANRLANEGRALVEARYSWAVAADRLDLFFRQLLAAGKEDSLEPGPGGA
jgi:glycosyltransferase involved in cell wall biosynthesis